MSLDTWTTSSFGAFLGGGPFPFGTSGAAAYKRLEDLIIPTLRTQPLLTLRSFADVDATVVLGHLL